MNQEVNSIKSNDHLRLLAQSGSKKTLKQKWNSNFGDLSVAQWNTLSSVAKLDGMNTTMLPTEMIPAKAVTSQPKINHISAITELSNHTDSINAVSAEDNFLDETLTTDTTANLENGDVFSNGNHDSFGGLTNHAFVEEDPTTPRPHNMNYTCAQPETCTKCNDNAGLIEKNKKDIDLKRHDLCPLPEVIEHEVTIVNKNSMTIAPGKALRKLDPRKLNLTLDLFSSRTKKKEKNKSNNSSNNSSLSPKSSSPFSAQAASDTVSESQKNLKCIPSDIHGIGLSLIKTSVKVKTTEPQTTPKTSWLLRLFESQVLEVNYIFFLECCFVICFAVL